MSNRDLARTLRLLLGQIEPRILLFVVLGLPTALLSDICFMIADLLYTSPLTSLRFNTLPRLFSARTYKT